MVPHRKARAPIRLEKAVLATRASCPGAPTMTSSSTRITPRQPNSLAIDVLPGSSVLRVFTLDLIQNENESDALIRGVIRDTKVERYGD